MKDYRVGPGRLIDFACTASPDQPGSYRLSMDVEDKSKLNEPTKRITLNLPESALDALIGTLDSAKSHLDTIASRQKSAGNSN